MRLISTTTLVGIALATAVVLFYVSVLSDGGDSNTPATSFSTSPWSASQFPLRNPWDSSSKGDAHIVMMGDSVMRYQFLDLTYRLHFCGDDDSALIAHPELRDKSTEEDNMDDRLSLDELHQRHMCRPPDTLAFVDRWTRGTRANRSHSPRAFMRYYRDSTRLFKGSMSCDCSRSSDGSFNVSRIIENRCYRHPTRKLDISYIQLFGDKGLIARSSLNQLSPTTGLPATIISEVNVSRDSFWFAYISLLHFSTEYAPLIEPRPTHFVLNAGLWATTELVYDIRRIVKALHKITPNIVWRATSQHSIESTSMATESDRLAWQDGTHELQRLDLILRASGDCADVSLVGDASDSGRPLCYYVPLPQIPGSVPVEGANDGVVLMTKEMFADRYHPVPYVYRHWNAKLWPFLASLPW